MFQSTIYIDNERLALVVSQPQHHSGRSGPTHQRPVQAIGIPLEKCYSVARIASPLDHGGDAVFADIIEDSDKLVRGRHIFGDAQLEDVSAILRTLRRVVAGLVLGCGLGSCSGDLPQEICDTNRGGIPGFVEKLDDVQRLVLRGPRQLAAGLAMQLAPCLCYTGFSPLTKRNMVLSGLVMRNVRSWGGLIGKLCRWLKLGWRCVVEAMMSLNHTGPSF